jgi:hypothetical protein
MRNKKVSRNKDTDEPRSSLNVDGIKPVMLDSDGHFVVFKADKRRPTNDRRR